MNTSTSIYVGRRHSQWSSSRKREAVTDLAVLVVITVVVVVVVAVAEEIPSGSILVFMFPRPSARLI